MPNSIFGLMLKLLRQYLTAEGKFFSSFVEDWKQLFTTAELS
jgi:hypothetical protein